MSSSPPSLSFKKAHVSWLQGEKYRGLLTSRRSCLSLLSGLTSVYVQYCKKKTCVRQFGVFPYASLALAPSLPLYCRSRSLFPRLLCLRLPVSPVTGTRHLALCASQSLSLSHSLALSLFISLSFTLRLSPSPCLSLSLSLGFGGTLTLLNRLPLENPRPRRGIDGP